MKLDAKADGVRGVLVNADTGQPIWWARKADLATGEYEAFRADPDKAAAHGFKKRDLLYRGRCRLKFVPGNSARPQVPTILDANPKLPRRRRAMQVQAFEDRPCQHYACLRDAEWMVAVDEPLPPLVIGGKSFEVGTIAGVKWWCSWHYEWPELLYPDGSTDPIETVRARPD